MCVCCLWWILQKGALVKDSINAVRAGIKQNVIVKRIEKEAMQNQPYADDVSMSTEPSLIPQPFILLTTVVQSQTTQLAGPNWPSSH